MPGTEGRALSDEGPLPPGRPAGTVLDPASELGTPTIGGGTVVGAGRRGWTIRATAGDGGEPVAIKVGAAGVGGDRARRRFMAEAAALLALPRSHHVVPVLAAGVSAAGEPWLMTSWWERGSMADRLARGPLEVHEARCAGEQMAQGLIALDKAGLLHMNLTPANVLVGTDGTAAVDGMARRALAPGHGPGPVPAYVPPEVLEGGEWTVRGDVWSWAAVVHALLHGRCPWASEVNRGPAAYLLAMAGGKPAGLRRGDVPDGLRELIQRALSVEPGERPGGPAELVQALAAAPPSQTATLEPGRRSPDEAVGRPLGSSYLLHDLLGTGASGQVWRGERRWDHSAVAVKVLNAELAANPEQVTRFLRERTTLVGLTHPHLVPIFDLVAEGSTLAIVMGLVEGRDLRRLSVDRPTWPPDQLCWLLAQIASGVEAMHAAGIVHRDIKPENVLVETGPDGVGQARVTDFGLARALDGPSLTRATQLVGTVEYLAPELVADRPLTPAVDLYSLGVMAYEMLCGWRPFAGGHPASILRAHLELRPSRPPQVPDQLWSLLARCLAKDPEERPTAAALRCALLAMAPDLQGIASRDPAAWRPPAPGTDRAPIPMPGADRAPHPAPAAGGEGAHGRSPALPAEREGATVGFSRRNLPAPDAPATVVVGGPRWRRRVLIGATTLALGAGLGAGWALTHRTVAGRGASIDVTASVRVAGPGKVIVGYAPTRESSLLYYVIEKRAAPGGPVQAVASTAGPDSTFTVTNQATGPACYQAVALLRRPPRQPVAAPAAGQQCVSVP